MRKNKTKARLGQGETVLGTWLEELRSPAVTQLWAAAGLDFFVIDMEHGPFNMETMADIVRMARQVDITPIVRVPDLTWERVGRILDAGAQGLMLPRVEKPEEAEAFVSYLKYPPAGRRGMASGLGNTDFQWVTTREYIEFINEEILVIIQIENKEAVANLEALANVPGIDVFFIGPEDLSISLGLAGQQNHPQVQETISQIIALASSRNIFPGIHSSDLTALASLREQGVRMINYASDIEFLYNGAVQGLQALRGNQP
jgi:2-dehydro-3-deoxyglucarate aldolase/4-hydroxy-2-oxoheptanedioate aldolase